MTLTKMIRLGTRVADGIEAEKDGRVSEYVVELLLAFAIYSVVRQAVKES